MNNEAGLPPCEARLRRTEDKRVRFILLWVRAGDQWSPLPYNCIHSYLIGRNMVRFTLMFALSVHFTFRSNALISCLGTEFSPAGENSGGFRGSPRKGCLQTFKELPPKYAIVLPQAKCHETRHYFRNPPTKFFGGWGLSSKKVPASPVSFFPCPSFPPVFFSLLSNNTRKKGAFGKKAMVKICLRM